MKNYCEIIGYKLEKEHTEIKVAMKGNWSMHIKRFAKNGKLGGELKIDDGRTISAEQRKKIYACVRDIAMYCGEYPEYTKELMKYFYMERTGIEHFSLSKCPMTLARDFISFIIEFAFENDIPFSDLGINRTDDIEKYLWSCLEYKKCCICGAEAETHHIDTIGMGRDRLHYDDSEHRKMALCREHHTEAHKAGAETFCAKYHVFGIKYRREEDGEN